MSNDRTPMEDLLKAPVDEVEVSPDDPGTFPTDEAATPKPEAKVEDKPEAKTEKTESKPTVEQPGDQPEKTDDRRVNLPKWAHERLRANDEKTTAAERRAEAAERRARELEEQFQARGEQPQEAEFDPRAELQAGLYETRVQLGWDRAVEKHDQGYLQEAMKWSQDQATADPHFAQRVRQAADPVGYAVREFKKAQTESELAKYDYDVDKMVEARIGQRQPVVTQPTAQQPAAGDKGASRQQPAMPSDFASAPSGGGRTAPVFAGPTPLGDLIKVNKRG